MKSVRKGSSEALKLVVTCASAPILEQSIICAIRSMENVHANQIIPGNYVMNAPSVTRMFLYNAHHASAIKMDQMMKSVMQ